LRLLVAEASGKYSALERVDAGATEALNALIEVD
jgi:hypothetical protein